MWNRVILSGLLVLATACVAPALDAQKTLVCSGTRVNGTAFTFPFVPNTSPAPTLGVACVPSGKMMPKGTAVMGTAPKAAKVFAVVYVAPSTAGGRANTNGAAPASTTLVCSGTRVNGTAFTFPFVPNTSPAPTPGVACVPSGKTMPKGTAVMGTTPKAAKVFAVVYVAPSTAGGSANTNGAGPAGTTLVCSGTRVNGTAFTIPFVPNTSPAPTPGVACVPSGKTMPKGTAVMGTAPKAAKVFAVVYVAPSTAGGSANTNGTAPAGTTLVCSGTQVNGTAFTYAFVPNANPAPTPGAACAPNLKTFPIGRVTMGTAPKASTVLAAVFYAEPGSAANPNGNLPAGLPPMCEARGAGGAGFILAFAPNTSPAPMPNAACAASGTTSPTGSVVYDNSYAPTSKVFAVVVGAPSTAGGTPTNGTTASNTTSSTPAGTASAATPPPMLQDGIAQLQNAKANLQNAGNQWGVHRTTAISLIDQALDACGLSQTPSNGEMTSAASTDLPSLVSMAIAQLGVAQNDFQNAKSPWGGRREQALPYITQALSEAKLAYGNSASTTP
jgi:hypothetical protein